MSKKHNHIGHLSPELIEAYRKGTLSEKDQLAVEQYLAENPFEAEALEGLGLMEDANLDAHLEDLNQRIDDRLKKEKRPKTIFWTTRRIAAGVVLLLSASAWYFWPQEAITTRELTQATSKDTVEIRKNSTEESKPAPVQDSVEEKAQPKIESPEPDDNMLDIADNETWADLQAEKREEATRLEKAKRMDSQALMMAPPAPAKVNRDSLLVTPIELDVLDLKTQRLPTDSIPESLRIDIQQGDFNLDKVGRALAFRTSVQPEEYKTERSKVNQRIITGRVVGADDGLPLPQVTVLLKGTTIGTPTNADGEFSIPITVGTGILLFRYLGYLSQEIEIYNQDSVFVQLKPDVQSLGEVVVAGYGIERNSSTELPRYEYKEASPQGDYKAFNQYLKENLQYPEEARAQNIRGRVVVAFTVMPNGQLTDFEIVKSLGHGCDEEAIRLIKEGPAWEAKQAANGSKTASRVKVRIRFRP